MLIFYHECFLYVALGFDIVHQLGQLTFILRYVIKKILVPTCP